MEMLVIVPIFVIIGIRGFYLMGKWDDFLEKNYVSEEEKTVSAANENISDSTSGLSDGMDAIDEKREKYFHISDVLKSVGMIILASLIGFVFWKMGLSESNIIMVYILAVLIISVITTQRIYSLISSVVSVIVFNFLFTVPQYTLRAYEKDYPITFVIMFIAAFLTGTLATQVKIQAAKAAEAALIAQKEQLRVNLLRSISHDLRTPLTSISGHASNLLSNGDKFDNNTKEQLYLDIYDDSMWLINLVENLLAVTRIEDGQLNIRLSTEILDEIITEALQHINRKKEEHKIVFYPKEDFILVMADARLIVQVIINIVDNAIKYTQPGSEIVITTQKEQDRAIIRIADNGPGIPDEMKPQIFDMFYSGAKSVADSRRSLGLGLALCKAIVEAHGGTLELSDNNPRGAVFTFSLPVKEVNLHE